MQAVEKRRVIGGRVEPERLRGPKLLELAGGHPRKRRELLAGDDLTRKVIDLGAGLSREFLNRFYFVRSKRTALYQNVREAEIFATRRDDDVVTRLVDAPFAQR